MKVLIREIVDLDKPVNLSKLPPLQMIITAIMSSYRKTPMYIRRQEKAAAKEYKERAAREEMLKSIILTNIYAQIVKNTEMGKRDWTCECVKLFVSRMYEQTLMDIKDHPEFLQYHMTIEPCHPDLVRSFDKVPIVISIRPKVVGRDLYEKI